MLLHLLRLVWLALARGVLQTWAQVSTAQCVDEFKWVRTTYRLESLFLVLFSTAHREL